MTVPLLAAEGLGFLRNDERIFGPLDLHVQRGEALLVEGGNGAGKTTLLRVLAGLLPATEGRILIRGQRADHDAIARNALLLGHLLGHKGELTALENLRFAMGLFGRRDGADPEAALADVGLAGHEEQPARMLSAGQRKRLALARLSLLPAPLWLLDEPFANLDLEGIALVNRLIDRHLAGDGAALITSHGAYATGAYRTRSLRLGTAVPDLAHG
ncbi:MAG: heme ABC exporter ATP-binding protein CcmA [Lysobacteraceae bacterium]